MTTILVTGGAGFIGYNFLEYIHENTDWDIVSVDKLTYAGATVPDWPRSCTSYKCDIGDSATIHCILNKHRPDYIVNFAAETHVDRSIDESRVFIDTNVVSTYKFIVEVQRYYDKCNANVRFVQISTDEVFGDLQLHEDVPFSETSQYKPNNPYSATKAAGDHLIRAFHKTYGLPVILTNCSNNYGPYQYPEKFIPVIILKALGDKQIPVYGVGANVRDWIFVKDHCAAIHTICLSGELGDRYNIGSSNELDNLSLVKLILNKMGKSHDLISFVEDRKGHDLRYSMNAKKIQRELLWKAETTFDDGLETTIQWYHDNMEWVKQCGHLE